MVLAVPGFGSVDLTQVPESRHHILRHLFRAGVEYEPGPYSGQLTLFRSTGQHRRFTGVPAELGWGPYAKGGVNVIRFAGDHYDITRNDHTTARVAEILDRIVERGGT